MFDEKDLVSAKEARKLSENSLPEEALYELEEVNRCIRDAINKGQYNCWYYCYLHDQAIRRLESLGYKVIRRSNQIDNDCVEIEW